MECRKFLRGVLLLLLLSPYIFAFAPKNLDFFKDKPRSIAKDYYIYRYLKENNVSSKEALLLLGQTKRVTFKLFHLFAKKIDDKEFKKVSKCLKLPTKKLLKQDSDCIAIGLSLNDILRLDNKTKRELFLKLKNYTNLSHLLDILSKDDFYKYFLEDKKLYVKIFNGSNSRFRKAVFDKELSPKDIKELSNIRGFNRSIELIATQRDLKNLQKSLLHIEPTKSLSSNSLFFLALNAIEFNKKSLALNLLNASYNKAYYRYDRDKTLFWSYLITKERKYLDELNSSFDINIYTIFAHESLSTKFDNIISQQLTKENRKFDISNPFLWTKLLKTLKGKNQQELLSIAEKFKYKNSSPFYFFIMERATRGLKSYFPMPYYEYLKKYDTKRVAMILSIARQESHFIPSAVSASYALGMMQFMPFLVKALAKEEHKRNFDIDNIFIPQIAYSFANRHLNYLFKHLSHPLYIAYAYNGGIGFTRRLLKSGKIFNKGEHEPYMSIELVHYRESREYAKKVLANYIIYMQLLGEKISLKTLIKELSQ